MKSNMFGRLGLGRRNNNITSSSNTERTFCVTIPSNIRPGETFQVKAGGMVKRLTCPENSMPGDTMRVTVTQSNEDNGNPNNSSRSINGGGIEGGSKPPSLPLDSAPPSPPPTSLSDGQPTPQQTGKTIRFEVVVPNGVIPGHPFALLAGGMRVLVMCPRNAQPGQKIQFNVPVGLLNRPDGPKSTLAEITISSAVSFFTSSTEDQEPKMTMTQDKNSIAGDIASGIPVAVCVGIAEPTTDVEAQTRQEPQRVNEHAGNIACKLFFFFILIGFGSWKLIAAIFSMTSAVGGI